MPSTQSRSCVASKDSPTISTDARACSLQVNVTGEPQKAGFDPSTLAARDLAVALGDTTALDVVGLMTIARADAARGPPSSRCARSAMSCDSGPGCRSPSSRWG